MAQRVVWSWKPKTNPDQHPTMCPHLIPLGRQLHSCGFSAWSILGPNTTLNLSLPRSLILHLSRLLAWALTSALEGDHETGVALALATTLARTLTLAKALPSWGPNSNV